MQERENLIRWPEVEPLCLLRLLLNKFWLILMAVLIGVMAVSIGLFLLVHHTYSCSAMFSVTARSTTGVSAYYTNTSVASEVTAIYSKLFEGLIMEDIIHKDVGESVSGTITASTLEETNLISVKVTAESPRDALLIMQSLLNNYSQLSSYVSSTAVLTPLTTPNISITADRTYNELKLHILGGAAGGLVMIFLLIWLSLARETIQTSEGAKNRLDAKIIASIPHEKPAKNRFRKKKRDRSQLTIFSLTVSFRFAESIHRIAAKFEHEYAQGKQVFLFSSVSEAEGKSTLAANTALSLASRSSSVLFIDMDLRRPVQSEILGAELTGDQTFGELLACGSTPEKILESAVVDEETGMHSLLSTKSYTDMIELISSPLLAKVIQLARTRFNYIIIDSPPLGYFADSELISDLCDGTVLVVRQDVVPAPEINDAIDALRACKAEFLGCILNDMQHLSWGSAPGYGYGYGYGRYGKYGKYGKYSKYGYDSGKK